MLMLRPMGEDDGGEIYERVTYNWLHSVWFDPNLSPEYLDAFGLREMTLRIW